jgi:hypothetical protein
MNRNLRKALGYFQAAQVSGLLWEQTLEEKGPCKEVGDHVADSVISEIFMDEHLEAYRAEIGIFGD